MRQLLPYLLKYKARMLLGFLFIIIGNFISIFNPKVVQRAIDYLKQDIEVRQLLIYAGLVILIALLQGVFRFLMRRTIIVVSRLIENDLRNELFAKLQTLSNAFFQRNRTGDIMARLTNDLNAVRSVLGPGIMYTINTLTIVIFVLVMMLRISPLLTLFAFTPVPILVFVVNKFKTHINKRFMEVQTQFATISTRAQENLAGMRIVKSYVLEKSEIEDFNKQNRIYIDKNMHYMKVYAAFRPVMMLIVGIGIALILLVGGRMIVNNTITLGEFVAFNLYLTMMVWPTIALGWVVGIFSQGIAAMERLDYIRYADADIADEPDAVELEDVKGRFSFKNLNFKYPSTDVTALEDINLEVPAGNIVAIVGRTGSGKTTLMRLLTRTYDPPQDSIFLDDREIRKIKLDSLRRHIGYIPQETFLFSDSLHNNIAFGVQNASRKEIEQAAKIAQIHDSIVEFPKGYDTPLGERGINLSGGQKQRVAIARAILKQPRILLLDDALSAVDTVTEEAILNSLRSVMSDKTCFWVSHRISAIKNADQIIVLDQGRIVEEGTHAELLLANGVYADLYEKQKLEESIELAE